MELSTGDREALARAKALLEHTSFAMKIADIIGMPVEKAMALLPDRWADVVNRAAKKSLEAALRAALFTLQDAPQTGSRELLHKLAVTATGAGGGALGLVSLAVELPVSTTIMLRSIADIARSEGELLQSADGKLACLEVFALGGRTSSDDATESAYFVVRSALARAVSEAAEYLAQRGLVEEGAPVLVRLIARISARFAANVSQKVAAQSVPIIGAAGGAAINLLFMSHFQGAARGHFIVRRLERGYDPALVKAEYDSIPAQEPAGA
jgi:hypothetical protein